MATIQVLAVLLGYAAVFGVTLLARLDYRKVRCENDWDTRY